MNKKTILYVAVGLSLVGLYLFLKQVKVSADIEKMKQQEME